MAQKQMMFPMAEKQRKLKTLNFAESSLLSVDLPRDTVLKGIQLRLSGSVVTTFGSGTPVADALSTFDNIINRIEVSVRGSRVVKSVRPYMMGIQQLLTTTVLGERKSSAGAAASANPTVDAGFTYGTTTQITSVAETIYLPFEQVYCDPGKGRETTWLNLQGEPSAELKLNCVALAQLLGYANTAPVVFSSSTLAVEIVTIEAQDVPEEIIFSDFKQTFKEIQFTAQNTQFAIDINRGNKLSGLQFLARDGAAGSTTTATGKLRSDLLVTNMVLKMNGQQEIKATTWFSLQAENRARYGINAPYASNVSLLTGSAHMNMLARKNVETALDVSGISDQPQLFIDTADSSTVTYTAGASLVIMTEEIAFPR